MPRRSATETGAKADAQKSSALLGHRLAAQPEGLPEISRGLRSAATIPPVSVPQISTTLKGSRNQMCPRAVVAQTSLERGSNIRGQTSARRLKVSPAQSRLVKVNAFWGSGCPRQFLPISGRPIRPDYATTGPVKVSQSQSKLIQHKFYQMLCRTKTSTAKKHTKIPVKPQKLRQLR